MVQSMGDENVTSFFWYAKQEAQSIAKYSEVLRYEWTGSMTQVGEALDSLNIFGVGKADMEMHDFLKRRLKKGVWDWPALIRFSSYKFDRELIQDLAKNLGERLVGVLGALVNGFNQLLWSDRQILDGLDFDEVLPMVS
ncbi:hypothetical protein Tco_1483598 [Tanacetum coccineum]